jgi:hypothetical protein
MATTFDKADCNPHAALLTAHAKNNVERRWPSLPGRRGTIAATIVAQVAIAFAPLLVGCNKDAAPETQAVAVTAPAAAPAAAQPTAPPAARPAAAAPTPAAAGDALALKDTADAELGVTLKVPDGATREKLSDGSVIYSKPIPRGNGRTIQLQLRQTRSVITTESQAKFELSMETVTKTETTPGGLLATVEPPGKDYSMVVFFPTRGKAKQGLYATCQGPDTMAALVREACTSIKEK